MSGLRTGPYDGIALSDTRSEIMTHLKSNIVLIGMAGCGKSTIGRLLAEKFGTGFVDTDRLVETAAHLPLQDIFNDAGPVKFKEIEEKILLAVQVQSHVIATGGSSIYSYKGMMHLKKEGSVFLLDVALPVLEARVKNFASRGLVKRPGQSFAELYAERRPLYRKYADFSMDSSYMNPEEICHEIISQCRGRG